MRPRRRSPHPAPCVLAAVAVILLASAVVNHQRASAGNGTGIGASSDAADSVAERLVPPLTAAARAALARLSAAARAETTTNYSGRAHVALSYPAGVRSAVVDLRHEAGSGYRMTIASTTTKAGTTVVEPEDAPSVLSPLDREQLRVLAAHYTPSLSTGDRVAGRQTDLVELRDAGGRVAARYWLDRSTALPLQRIAYDAAGRVRRASAFTSVTLTGSRPAAAGPTHPVRQQAGGAVDLVRLRGAGWQVPALMASRGLELIDAQMVQQSPQALHLRYSDGISAVSVFEERGHLDASGLRAWQSVRRAGAVVRVAPGVPEQVVWSSRGCVYTVVADDADDVDAAIAQLPHAPAASGVRARLWRGVQRVGSWLDPTS